MEIKLSEFTFCILVKITLKYMHMYCARGIKHTATVLNTVQEALNTLLLSLTLCKRH